MKKQRQKKLFNAMIGDCEVLLRPPPDEGQKLPVPFDAHASVEVAAGHEIGLRSFCY